MSPDPEASPSISEQIQAKFKKAVLAEVAKLSKNAIVDPPLLNRAIGDPMLECRDAPNYSRGPEAEVLLHYTLRGKPELFQEHLPTLLGDEWWSEGQTVTVSLFPDVAEDEDDSSDIPELLKARNKTLKDALTAYHAELANAREALLHEGKRAANRQALADSFLPDQGVYKQPEEPSRPRFRPQRRPGFPP